MPTPWKRRALLSREEPTQEQKAEIKLEEIAEKAEAPEVQQADVTGVGVTVNPPLPPGAPEAPPVEEPPTANIQVPPGAEPPKGDVPDTSGQVYGPWSFHGQPDALEIRPDQVKPGAAGTSVVSLEREAGGRRFRAVVVTTITEIKQ